MKPSKPNLVNKLKNDTGLIDVSWEKLTIPDLEKIINYIDFFKAEVEYDSRT